MTWQESVTLAAAVAAWIWSARSARRTRVLLHAAEAVAFAEKYYWGASNESLEREALRYFEEHWPSVPSAWVRALVREVCRRRKVRAKGLTSETP